MIEIEREALLTLVQTDSELSDIFLRAFIRRRLTLIARGIGDLILIGSSHSLDTFRIKEFLTRNYQRSYALKLDGDEKVPARTVVIASGAQYRKLSLINLAQFEGPGI